jgi:hypothetical protein
MTKRTRILLFILGIIALAAVIWIAPQLKIREVSYTDESVNIELTEPAGT